MFSSKYQRLSTPYHSEATYYDYSINNFVEYPSFEGVTDVDVCIVGGGFAGLNAQLGLLERGFNDVVLLESHRVGSGASGRNGGFVFGGFSLAPKALVNQIGQKRARQVYKLSVDAVELIRDRINSYKIDCDCIDKGVLLANWFKSQDSLLKQQAFMANALGVEWEYVAPDNFRALLDSSRYHGGLYEKNAMHFNPLKYLHGIAAVIQNKGGQIFENSCVIDINAKNGNYELTVSQGRIRCKKIILCAGGYIRQFFPKVSRGILPVNTYIMVTEPLGERLRSSINTQSAIYDTRFAFDYYRPLIDSRLLWGGRISTNINKPANLKEKLYKDLLKVFPELNGVKIDFVWNGLMAYTRTQMPCIGEISKNIWSNIGFGGHGVAPTTMAGELIASAICENDENYKMFSEWGLPWAGGRLGTAAVKGQYWYKQMKDFISDKLF